MIGRYEFKTQIKIAGRYIRWKQSIKQGVTEIYSESNFSVPLKEARENFEKDYLTTQLKKFGGNVSKTAKFVGMERSALHRKLKDLGVKDLN